MQAKQELQLAMERQQQTHKHEIEAFLTQVKLERYTYLYKYTPDRKLVNLWGTSLDWESSYVYKLII